MPAPDPDAAPPAAAPPPAAGPIDKGTLADTVERYPVSPPVKVTAAPLAGPPQSWSDWATSGWGTFGKTTDAAETLQIGDNSLGYENALRKGYAPLVEALGLDQSENPAQFDPYPDTTFQRYAHLGANNRDAQEQKLADLIKAARAKDPKALAGVPDDPVGLRKYAMAADTKEREAARATEAQGGGGLGSLVGQLYGSFKGSLADPAVIATLPIGGEGKTLLQVAGREALTNGMIAAVTLPGQATARAARGEAPLTGTEAVEQVAGAAAGGAVLGTAFHGAGQAIAATGLPQKIAGVVGNLDLANTLSYKIYSNLPEAMQRKWGAGIVTKWAHRLADGEKLEDVFSNLSNVELATLSKHVIGEGNMTPEESAAAEHITRNEEIGATSPYQPTPEGDAAHEGQLQANLEAIINNRPVAESPSAPLSGGSDAGVSSAPARPPAATSTAARRPLPPASGPARLPSDIYEGLVKRGIPDEVARGVAAGSYAESRGKVDALGPVTAATHGDQAFGIGQWLGPRKAELFRKYGASPTLDQQLDHLVWELRGGDHGGRSVLGAHDEVDALNRYIRDFMRPGAGDETTKDLGRGMAALGRGTEQLPDVGELAGGSAPVDIPDDPNIARLRDDATQLDDQVIGIARKPNGDPVNAYARRVNVSDMNVDADRFQFKAGGDQHGITDRLRGVEEIDPLSLGRLTLWEDHGGKMYVADGHQRTGLLKRELAQTGVDRPVDVAILRAADGVTAEDARTMAAIKNLGEDSGTKIDAAKVGRANADALERAAKRLPKTSALIRDGRALAKLSDDAFGSVVNDVIPPDFAAVIGHLLPDRPEVHGAMVDLLNKLDPANRGQAESIVRQAIAAGMHTGEETDLFGDRAVTRSLMIERAKVLEKGLSRLRRAKLIFKTAADEAGTLERVGSKIAKSASEKEAQANAQALELVSRLAFTHGPVADALNDAARKLAAGAKLADVADEFASTVRSIDLGSLAGSSADDDAGRLVPDGAGRGGDAGEAGETIPGEQPSLTDLEHATERFSNPDGPAVKQQAESLVHDLKAKIDAEPKSPAMDAFERERETTSAVGLGALLQGGEHGELGGWHWRHEADPEGDWIIVSKPGEEGEYPLPINWLIEQQLPKLLEGAATDGSIESGELARILEEAQKLDPSTGKAKAALEPGSRREKIKAATAALEDTKPGEFRTVEPFKAEEPGYHRFRYVGRDGEAVSGNYTVDGNTIEGFNIGDTNNPVQLGSAEIRNLIDQLKAEHPDVKYVQAYRKSGARTKTGGGEQEIWLELTDKGIKFSRDDPRPGAEQRAAPAAAEPTLDRGEQVDPAIADRQRQELALKAGSPMQSINEQLGTMGLGLFDHIDQPRFELDDEARSLIGELDADEKAVKAMKDCL